METTTEKTEEQLKRQKRNKINNERLKNTEWYCDVCGNGKNYTYRGKYMHLKTKKHYRNLHNIEFTGALISL